MADIAIIADKRVSAPWMDALLSLDHNVVCFEDAVAFGAEFDQSELDIMIVDVARPNQGEALLIAQARAEWPSAKVIAAVSSYKFRSSAVYKMGLWSPDYLLVHPVSARVLQATVSFLWAQIRTDRIMSRLARSGRTPTLAAPPLPMVRRPGARGH
ncbi:MAG: hypothetical protein AAF334_00630 [Pseudomonadota bacterium]